MSSLSRRRLMFVANHSKLGMWFIPLALAACVVGFGNPAATALSPATQGGLGRGPAPVDLGSAGDFVILAQSGITNVPGTAITGNLGVSPIDSTAITGFSLILEAGATFSTSSQVTGKVYAADYPSPTPANLTAAIGDMETAYLDAAGRLFPDYNELNDGNIGGLTLPPGLYKWTTSVTILDDVTLEGGPDDVWIFQISGDLSQANATRVTLAGGAQTKNIFWQLAGVAALGTTAHMEGQVLSKTAVTLNTGASVNGSLFAGTNVTLIKNAIVKK